MRPRGESFSTPSSRYVGLALRHRPQWSHLSRSACAGPAAEASNVTSSDTAIETRPVQKVLRIEHLLDAFHHGKRCFASGCQRPELALGSKFCGAAFDQRPPAEFPGGAQQ